LSARPALLLPALGFAVVPFAPGRELLELRDFEPDPEPLDLVAIRLLSQFSFRLRGAAGVLA
jgi:hypothetical protein